MCFVVNPATRTGVVVVLLEKTDSEPAAYTNLVALGLALTTHRVDSYLTIHRLLRKY